MQPKRGLFATHTMDRISHRSSCLPSLPQPDRGNSRRKLAALSRWYEFYYDVYLDGIFTFHTQDLHEKYGMALPVLYTTLQLTAILRTDSSHHTYGVACPGTRLL
jgi:hypothetical protein